MSADAENDRISRPHETRRRQRAMRQDLQVAKQAMRVVLPTNQEIGPWQQRAAWLLALAEKLKTSGGYDPRISKEAEALLRAVEQRHQRLEEDAAALPDAVARSTRLEDTQRALTSVASVLRRTIQLSARERDTG